MAPTTLTRLHVVAVGQHQRHNNASIVRQGGVNVGHYLVRIGAAVEHVQAHDQIDAADLGDLVDDAVYAITRRFIIITSKFSTCMTHVKFFFFSRFRIV